MLVALILLPFTPPFKTYDLETSQRDGVHDWLVKDKVGSDEQVVGAAGGSLVPPVLNVIALRQVARRDVIDEPQIQSLILRV